MDLDILYSAYNNAQSTRDIASHRLILSTTRSDDPRARQLATQFIPDLFLLFPENQDDSVERMFDLCEDPEKFIRIQAIKKLPLLIKHSGKVGLRIADVLIQLLQAQDLNELETTKTSLLQAIKISPSVSTALFDQSDALVRELSLDYLKSYQSELMPILGKAEQEFGDAACMSIQHSSIEGVEFLTGLIFQLGFYQNYTKLVDTLVLWFTESSRPDFWSLFVRISHLCRTSIKKGGNPGKFIRFLTENILPLQSIPDKYLILALRHCYECLKTNTKGTELQLRLSLVEQLKSIDAQMNSRLTIQNKSASNTGKQPSETILIIKLVNEILDLCSALPSNVPTEQNIPPISSAKNEPSSPRPRKRKLRQQLSTSKKRHFSEPTSHSSLYIQLPPPRNVSLSTQPQRHIQVRGISRADKLKQIYAEEPSLQVDKSKMKIDEQPKWSVRNNMKKRGYTLTGSHESNGEQSL